MCASENDIIEEEAIKEKQNSIEGIIFNFLLQWMNDTEWMNMRLRPFRDFFNLLKRYSKVPLPLPGTTYDYKEILAEKSGNYPCFD